MPRSWRRENGHVGAPSEILLFEDFRLDRRGGGLFCRNGDGTFEAVAIGSRGLDILGVLIERAGEIVSVRSGRAR